jgi:MFS family permease
VKAQTASVVSRMQKPQASSSFSALANVAFSRLWVAALASGTAVAADQTAARWALIHFSESAFIISLLSSTAALPFLLFTLPAGFLADAVDRRPLLQTINVWQALVRTGLYIAIAAFVQQARCSQLESFTSDVQAIVS